MSDDTVLPDPPKRGSEVAFYGLIAILMVAVFGGAAYFLGAFDSSKTKTPVAAPGPNHSSSRSPGATGSKAAPVAVVEKNYRLTVAGKYGQACALESPTYLRFDAGQYSHGSCAAELGAVMGTVRSQGLSMKLTSTKLESFAEGQATVLAKFTVGSKASAATFYLQFHGTKWWITGGDDSGDLGY